MSALTEEEEAWLRAQQALARKVLAVVEDPEAACSMSPGTLNELRHLLRTRGYRDDGTFAWEKKP